MGPVLPAEGTELTELTDIHFRLGVVAEMGCGISGGELAVHLALTRTRHSLLLSHIDKGHVPLSGGKFGLTDRQESKEAAHTPGPSLRARGGCAHSSALLRHRWRLLPMQVYIIKES